MTLYVTAFCVQVESIQLFVFDDLWLLIEQVCIMFVLLLLHQEIK